MQTWRDTALIVAGHGSSRNPASRLPTLRLGEILRARGLFAEVREAYLKEPPFLPEVLAMVKAPEAFVVPNFAGHGYLTRTVVPREMGLSGRLTRRSGEGPARVWYTDPVGCHPRIPAILHRRALAALAEKGLAAGEACLLIIGHGSRRPGGSAGTTEAVAAALRAMGEFAEVRTAYLEQAPAVRDWREFVGSPNVVAIPFLMAEGLHGGEDLPPLFGLAPGQTGIGRVAGRSVWFCPGLGGDEDMAEIVLDQIRKCQGEASE